MDEVEKRLRQARETNGLAAEFEVKIEEWSIVYHGAVAWIGRATVTRDGAIRMKDAFELRHSFQLLTDPRANPPVVYPVHRLVVTPCLGRGSRPIITFPPSPLVEVRTMSETDQQTLKKLIEFAEVQRRDTANEPSLIAQATPELADALARQSGITQAGG
jgi:hypothetical protein